MQGVYFALLYHLSMQTSLADELRLEIVNFIKQERDNIFPGDNDDSSGQFWSEYGSFAKRMIQMNNLNEFAGEPEIVGLVHYLKLQIWIWYRSESNECVDMSHAPTVYDSENDNVLHI